MKRIVQITLILLLTCFTSSLALASFTIPNYVYTVSQLATAQKKAKKSSKPITFVYANKNTTCGLGTSASKDLFKGLNNYSIVVYAERRDWNEIPNIVKSGINSPESGEYIPKTVVVSSSMDTIICIVPYAKTKQRKILIKQAQNLINSY